MRYRPPCLDLLCSNTVEPTTRERQTQSSERRECVRERIHVTGALAPLHTSIDVRSRPLEVVCGKRSP